MDEMSVRLGDGTDLREASLFGFTNMPSLFGGSYEIKNQKCEGPGRGGGHEPSLKKPGDFTVAEGHGHPLVNKNISNIFLSSFFQIDFLPCNNHVICNILIFYIPFIFPYFQLYIFKLV